MLYRDITPKIMKTRVAEEAEESTTMINGSKGIIARMCGTSGGNLLMGNRAVASHHEGIGPPPCIYVPIVSYGSTVKGKRW